MIGPIDTPATGRLHSVKLKPSGVEVPTPPLKAQDASSTKAEQAPVDTTRVVELRSAIQSGVYIVDAKAVAEAMLKTDLSDR